ncbi:MAG: CoA transferase [Intrasporangium sp.]|uniref:CaiB/BaiF CoA transferase family protein n=1 Tax=Intrasporangium sp. TaxID=1925024 RepID=UPI00264731ED|nr:CoA transferase [Intrasporangium sp.]MDN5796874.1 CoA transferase [Intrasporangium sp.]
MTAGPLAGVIVVDLTRYISGPYCTMLLADAGATVIKVEPPGGEHTRHGKPRLGDRDGGPSASFVRVNRGKQSIVLDLKTEDGVAALARLLAKADVLVENFRPGVLARLGLDEVGLERLNPGLVYCTITGFGHSPSGWRDRPAFNLIAELEAGVYWQRDPDSAPEPLGPYVGDLFPGAHATSGIAMALYQRERTGRGARVDIAMFDSMLSFNELACTSSQFLDGRVEDYFAGHFCPSDIYPSGDGYVCLDVVTQEQWCALCDLIGAPELAARPDLADGPGRAGRFDEVIAGPLLGWLAGHDAETAMQRLTAVGVPAAVVRTPGEALCSRQARDRQMVVAVGHAGHELLMPANPIRVQGASRPQRLSAPEAGEHTLSVLTEVAGLTREEVAALTKEAAGAPRQVGAVALIPLRNLTPPQSPTHGAV